MLRKTLTLSIMLATIVCFTGCEMWEAAAARAAKKRTTQTGPVVGEIEDELDVEDPLGRKQKSLDGSSSDEDPYATAP